MMFSHGFMFSSEIPSKIHQILISQTMYNGHVFAEGRYVNVFRLYLLTLPYVQIFPIGLCHSLKIRYGAFLPYPSRFTVLSHPAVCCHHLFLS
jgi:hypothetical protein